MEIEKKEKLIYLKPMIYPVRIIIGNESKNYDTELQTSAEFVYMWQSVLKHAYRNSVVECLCPGVGNKRLAIKYYSESDIYLLSKYPKSGHNHSKDCKYYGDDKQFVKTIYRKAVEKMPDGTDRIKLSYGLKEVTKKIGPPKLSEKPVKSDKAQIKTAKPVTTLLSLLHLLWHKAKLNLWSPRIKIRSITEIMQQLRRASRSLMNKSMHISDVLVLGGDSPTVNEQIINKAIKERLRPLIIAQIAKWTRERENLSKGCLSIANFQGIPYIKISKKIWEKTKKKFPHAITAWKAGYRVIAIIHADKPRNLQAIEALDIAFMPVSLEWIPIDSIYEGKLEEKLRQEKRTFYKPIIYQKTDKIFPDFILLDTENKMPLEVFGFESEKYEIRKEEKIDYYNQKYGQGKWWYWDAAKNTNIPELPPKKLIYNNINTSKTTHSTTKDVSFL